VSIIIPRPQIHFRSFRRLSIEYPIFFNILIGKGAFSEFLGALGSFITKATAAKSKK